MPVWATVVITLGTGLIAASAALAGTWFTERFRRRQRDEDRREARLERTAAVLGPLARLLEESLPERVAFNLGPDSLDQHHDRWVRWQALHVEVLVLAAGHPSGEFVDALKRLSSEVANAVMAAGWLASDHVKGESRDRETYERARAEHAQAQELLEKVQGMLRGD